MFDLTILKNLASACRTGLQSLTNQTGSVFAGFPSGSCGPAAEIVGRIIKEHAGYEGVYVCGSGHAQLSPTQTHAWFEVGDYVIDITHDQFENNGLAGWVFQRGVGWHEDFAERDVRAGFCMPAGWPSYPFDGYAAVKAIVTKKPE